MSMTKCPECESAVSEKALLCFRCGSPQRSNAATIHHIRTGAEMAIGFFAFACLAAVPMFMIWTVIAAILNEFLS